MGSNGVTRPIGLTDFQKRLLRDRAARVPHDRRDDFLRLVASQLGESPSNDALVVAVTRALGRVLPTNFREQKPGPHRRSPQRENHLATHPTAD